MKKLHDLKCDAVILPTLGRINVGQEEVGWYWSHERVLHHSFKISRPSSPKTAELPAGLILLDVRSIREWPRISAPDD